jgi:hypothetical protein
MFSRSYLKTGLLVAVLGSIFSVSAATQPAKEAPQSKFVILPPISPAVWQAAQPNYSPPTI